MTIAHATDLSGDDTAAFLHALALAAHARSRLVTVYAGRETTAAPRAAELTAHWPWQIDHEFRHVTIADAVADSVLEALRDVAPELVVVGTHARHGLGAVLHGSVAEAIARNFSAPVLVVPNHVRGFVDPRAGTLDLTRVIIPAGHAREARRGIDAARRFLTFTGQPERRLELVHVGAPEPELAGLGVTLTSVEGNLEDGIVGAARDACLLVMPTRGHDSAGDVVFGSHTERVIRDARCPVLVVPL
ncbi:MAG TPA: universal stress protein [Kofleriaceae bacterium]|nr:universal stress protein [Kofleriaceae bacterium]